MRNTTEHYQHFNYSQLVSKVALVTKQEIVLTNGMIFYIIFFSKEIRKLPAPQIKFKAH